MTDSEEDGGIPKPIRGAWTAEDYDRIAEGLRRAARNGSLRIQPGRKPGMTIRDPETGEILFPRPEHYLPAPTDQFELFRMPAEDRAPR